MFLVGTVLSRVQDLMGTWGYPVLFGLLLSCGMGVPLPEDIPLILAGYFVAIGKMKLVWAALSAWCGIVGGDCILYSFGRRYGLGVSRVPVVGKHVTPERIKWVEVRFQKYGILMVGVGRMFAGIRGAMVLTAGTIRFRFLPFIIADGLAAVVSGGLFMGLGYWAGRALGDLDALREKIKHYEDRILIAILLLAAVVGCWMWLKKRWTTSPAPITTMPPATNEPASTLAATPQSAATTPPV